MSAWSDVIIIGGGVAGLVAAGECESGGLRCTLLEASDQVGGRVRTDLVEGFRLDRGFQIFLTAYPECRRLLDYSAMGLRNFVPGALCWTGENFERLSDPRRDVSLRHWWENAVSSAAGFADKLRALRLVLPLLSEKGEAVPTGQTTERMLAGDYGFSSDAIRRFWRPFLSGVFLERDLTTDAGFARFTLRMFAEGDAALPALGIEAIPRRLLSRLKNTHVRLGCEAAQVDSGEVLLSTGERIRGRAVLVATEQRSAYRLLHLGEPPPNLKATACLYFAAPQAPVEEPILMLDGEGTGPINTVVVPTVVQPSYGPGGTGGGNAMHLVSLSTVGWTDQSEASLQAAALEQMTRWFGPQVNHWRHLRTYRVPEALPPASPSEKKEWVLPPRVAKGLYRAGDAWNSPSLNGAMASGRLAAEAILADLGK